MKKLILSIVALLCMNVGSNAQSVYNEIREKAKAEVENSDSNGLIRQINQF